MNARSTWSVPALDAISGLTHNQLSEHIRLADVNVGHYQNVVEALKKELESRSPTLNYRCMKCGHEEFELNQMRVTRSFLGSFFGVESAQYKAVVCARCKYTEFYQGVVPAGQQALDFVFGQ